MAGLPDAERMLRPREVALLFKVDPKTVTRWAKTGRLTPVVLPSGHRRYRAVDVEALMSSTSRKMRVTTTHICGRCGTHIACGSVEA